MSLQSSITYEEKLNRFEDIREIKNLMGRMSADYLDCKQSEILSSYWSRRDDICLALNNGYFTGVDEIKSYYDNQSKRIALASSLIKKHFPDDLDKFTEKEAYGVGHMDYKPVETDIIEVAQDRKTAKGIWCLRGAHVKFTPYGPQGMWEWGWFAADFIMENDEWRIWHLQYIQDMLKRTGKDWIKPAPTEEIIPEFAPLADFKDIEPPHPAVLHENYHSKRKFSQSPRIPEPYASFADTFSYGMPDYLERS